LVGLSAATTLAIKLTEQVVLALTGTLAVTVGFALKDLAASVIAGVIILMDRPFQVGDRVSFGGVYGEISEIGLRSVRLVTLDDNVITIPNNKFLTDIVSSGNWGALDMLIQMDFHIGVDQDIALAKRLVTDAITSCRYVYTKKPWSVSIKEVTAAEHFAIRVRAKVYVLDVQYETAMDTDVNERVYAAFRQHGILPPAHITRSMPDAPAVPVPPAESSLSAPAAPSAGTDA
jgi:small-conductance mechanosensitive channel